MSIFPPLIVMVESECKPSSPEVTRISPPLIVKVSFEWIASSEESIFMVPLSMVILPAAFSALALMLAVSLSVSSFLPQFHQSSRTGLALFALPPPENMVISPPSIVRFVAAWIPSSPAVISIVPLSIETYPLLLLSPVLFD